MSEKIEHTNEYWMRKARLWFVLHQKRRPNCEQCPAKMKIENTCGHSRNHRLYANKDYTRWQIGCTPHSIIYSTLHEDDFDVICIEWIKHV